MATIAQDNVIVRFIAKTDKFRQDRKRVLAETEKEANQVAGRFSRIADVAGGVIGASLIQGALSGMVSLGSQAVQLSKDYEQTKVSFEVLTGSVENATTLLADLDRFSLSTPFEPEEINNSAKTLLGFGRSVSQVKEDLEIIGEASAATGADLQNLAVIFGQVAGAGKLQGGDALQLINAGIPVYDLLSQSLNVSTGELKVLQSQGKITFDDLREAFDKARQEGGKFENALIKQSTTFAGLASTASGAGKAILRNLGDALLPLVREVLPVIIDGLFSLVDVAKRVAEPLGRVFVGAFNVIRSSVQPVTDAVRRLFARFEAGTGVLEKLQPALDFVAQIFAITGQAIGLAVDAFGSFLSAIGGSSSVITSLAEALSTIPAILGGIVGVVQSIPAIFREGFGNAGQFITDFVQKLALVLNPSSIAGIITGQVSIADLIAINERRRIAEIANGTRQVFTGFGEEISKAYAEGYDSIADVKFEIPPIDTPENKEAASISGEEIGKEVAKGVGKGLKEQISSTSLAGLKAQLSELEKELSQVADPTADGIENVLSTLEEIGAQKKKIQDVEDLIARINGEQIDRVTDFLPEADGIEERLVGIANKLAKDIKPVSLIEDPEEVRERTKAAAVEALEGARDLANQLLEIREERINGEISQQEERLNALLEIADQGNAEQVQLERDRLRKLQVEKEKAVQARQRLAAVEIAVNTAVSASESIRAITSAFAAGNIPLGIATAASLALTVASTALTISNAFGSIPSFRVGTDNFQPNSDDGTGGYPAMLHRGERVLTAEQNRRLLGWGVSNEDLPELVGLGLGRIKTPSFSSKGGGSGLRQEIAELRKTNDRLAKAIKQNRPAVLFDENGLKVISENQARKVARKRHIRRG